MFRTTVQSVLLIAVVYSQVLGGISCCCLGRTLLAGVNCTDQPAGATGGAEETPVNCPKCLAKTAAAREQCRSSSAEDLGLSVAACENGQCRCAKLVVNASNPNGQDSVSVRSANWPNNILLPYLTIAETPIWLIRHEVPLRFGGHSWQSIACVWKN